MTRPRKIAVGAAVLAVLVVALPLGWDFLQLGRRTPAIALPEQRANRIVVDKSACRLTLMRDGVAQKSYDVALGGDPVGHKQQEGDGRTPEGIYAVDFKHPRSRFHLALRISYPNPADRAHAQNRGVAPGGDIMIHGLPNGLGWVGSQHLTRDWTDGCIAVTNAQIEEIWSRVEVGTTVEIRP